MGLRLTYNFDTWGAATATASSEASSDLAASNVLTANPSEIWRSTGVASEWLKFDQGSAVQITCIGLFNFNFTSSATITLEGNASDSWGAPTYSQALSLVTDSDSVVLKRLVFFLDETFRWWRITFADAGNSDGYLQIGRVAAGIYYEPPRDIRGNYRFRGADPSVRDRVPGAYVPAVSRRRFRTVDVSFPYITQAQNDKLFAIFSKIGNEQPLIVSVNPTGRATEDSMYCTLETDLPMAHTLVSHFDVALLTFEEKVR